MSGGLDFLVLGAQKGGTTTLWHLLRGHPQLAFPAAKEAALFTDETRMQRGLESYLEEFFADAQPGTRRGTISPSYMTGVTGPHARGVPIETVAERAAQTVPQVKLIALLRDPVRRAISHYRMSRRRSLEARPLDRALREQMAPGTLQAARARPSETNSYVVAGEYGRILAAYLGHFPRSALLVALTSELDTDPDSLLVRLLRFLDVDDTWRPQEIQQRHLVGGDELRIPVPEARALLEALKAPLPEAMGDAIELAFEDWNTVSAPAAEALPEPLARDLGAHFAADGVLLGELCDMDVPWAAPPPPRPRAPVVSTPETSIVILVHDTPGDTESLLESIVRYTDGAYEILLLDNGSSPAAARELAALADAYGARLVTLDANLTFSVAGNMGVRISGAEEIVLLNSDVEVTENWLRNLRAVLHSASDIGAVGPRTNFSRGAQSGIWLDDSSPAGVREWGHFFNHPDPTRWFDIDWLTGFAILVRRSAFEGVGGFDETIPWHGLEDRALGEALRNAGWRSVCAGDTFVYHAGHRTFDATGANRTASRFQRRTAPPGERTGDPGRLLKDAQGLVFEVRDGIAYHFETAPGFVRGGRPIENAAPGELESLPIGPPISICRARGSDDVWVLYHGSRRPVIGDRQRIRRLPWVSMADPQALEQLPQGPPVRVDHALPPVPEIQPRLPVNPAEIVPERLAGAERVAAEIGQALDSGGGYALIHLGVDDLLVLNLGMWPVGYADRDRAGVRQNPVPAAGLLRRAIVDADAVAVIEDRSRLLGAALLEQLLFHYELYPRLRCRAHVGYELAAIDPDTGAPTAAAPLPELLTQRRIALVCPRALVPWARTRPPAYWRQLGYDVRVVAGLDDLRDVGQAFLQLAVQRGDYDAVLVVSGVPAKPLCGRLARELNVVALDLGHALDHLLPASYQAGANRLVTLRAAVESYLDELGLDIPYGRHELEGRLLRVGPGGAVYYVERGAARELLHPAFLSLFDHEPADVAPAVVRQMRRGTPLCAVHEPLGEPYVLLGGKKVRLRLGVPLVALLGAALESIPEDDRDVTV